MENQQKSINITIKEFKNDMRKTIEKYNFIPVGIVQLVINDLKSEIDNLANMITEQEEQQYQQELKRAAMDALERAKTSAVAAADPVQQVAEKMIAEVEEIKKEQIPENK